MANIGKVAVMQEPVAAIMSVVNGHSIKNGTFLILIWAEAHWMLLLLIASMVK